MPITLRPPEEIDYVKLPDYAEIAGRFAGYCCSIGGLRPDGRVLDVGCGLGPLALGLADYLNADGRYEGLDIVKAGIEWCQREITSRFSNFHFHLADVQNNNTNPHGRFAGSSYSFPYKDESFDLVFMRSVFTQMPSSDLERYVEEIERVLAPGGRFLGTFFLLNQESLHLMDTLKKRAFPFVHGVFRTTESNGRGGHGYDELYVRSVFTRCRLKIVEPIYYGFWCGRPSSWDSQDLVIAKK
jgi:SAM-dependent methyltransferase